MVPLTFATIAWESEQYEQAIQLRNLTLRIPLGLKLSSQDRQSESDQLHFGAFDAEHLIGCVSVVPVENLGGKVRQMAVEPDFQGKGVGTFLMRQVEQELVDRGMRFITLHARESATGFYQRLGYHAEGETFIEVSIPHVRMTKSIIT